MQGHNKEHNYKNSRGKGHDDELLSDETLYAWRKKAAIEIQFLTRTKKEFYKLYLRNNN